MLRIFHWAKELMKGIVICITIAIMVTLRTSSESMSNTIQGFTVQSAFIISIGFGLSVCLLLWSRKNV